MRKYLLCSLALALLFLISIYSADATLLGVDLADRWPDIDSNNIGLVKFTPNNPGTPGQGGNVTYSAFANRIAYSMSDVDSLLASNPSSPPPHSTCGESDSLDGHKFGWQSYGWEHVANCRAWLGSLDPR